MKKIINVISIVLVVIMLFTLAVPAFAVEKEGDVYPEIYVPGFEASKIYTDKDNPETEISMPDKDYLIDALKKDIVPAFIAFAADKNTEKLGKKVADFINSTFADYFNNPDGSAVDNSGAAFVYPGKGTVISAPRLSFRYDWRGDPVEIAAELDAYINYVLECTGSDKVAISSHSLGGVITLTYLSIYGNDKVMGVVFDTPAIDGLTSVGELFSGKATFASEGIAALLKMVIGTTEYEELWSSVVDIFSLAGINESLSDFLNDAYEKIGPVLFKETLFPLFGCWPSIWSMIPDEYIDDVMVFVFEGDMKGQEYDGLRARVENYNEKVRKNKTQTLVDFDKNARVAVITRYGYNAVPMTDEWTMLSDTVIETKRSSLGATTAPVGEYFSDEYLEGKDMKYISPDKTVDASTCLFADKTWFVKNTMHSENEVTVQFFAELLFGEEEATCDNSELSRYMIYDREKGVVVVDESVPEKAEEPTFFQRIFNFIKAIINKIIDFFTK